MIGVYTIERFLQDGRAEAHLSGDSRVRATLSLPPYLTPENSDIAPGRQVLAAVSDTGGGTGGMGAALAGLDCAFLNRFSEDFEFMGRVKMADRLQVSGKIEGGEVAAVSSAGGIPVTEVRLSTHIHPEIGVAPTPTPYTPPEV